MANDFTKLSTIVSFISFSWKYKLMLNFLRFVEVEAVQKKRCTNWLLHQVYIILASPRAMQNVITPGFPLPLLFTVTFALIDLMSVAEHVKKNYRCHFCISLVPKVSSCFLSAALRLALNTTTSINKMTEQVRSTIGSSWTNQSPTCSFNQQGNFRLGRYLWLNIGHHILIHFVKSRPSVDDHYLPVYSNKFFHNS